MRSAVLNVSIDTETPEGERLRDLILGGDNKNGWLCAAWIDRTKYNPIELLRESEEARMKMKAWIGKAVGLMVRDDDTIDRFSDLIDEAPI